MRRIILKIALIMLLVGGCVLHRSLIKRELVGWQQAVVTVDPNGLIYTLCYKNNDRVMEFSKFNAAGKILWRKRHDAQGRFEIWHDQSRRTLIVDEDGSIYHLNRDEKTSYLSKYDPVGNLIWVIPYINFQGCVITMDQEAIHVGGLVEQKWVKPALAIINKKGEKIRFEVLDAQGSWGSFLGTGTGAEMVLKLSGDIAILRPGPVKQLMALEMTQPEIVIADAAGCLYTYSGNILMKRDPSGKMIWWRWCGSDFINKVAPGRSGVTVFYGRELIRLDNQGGLQWKRDETQRIISMTMDKDDALYAIALYDESYASQTGIPVLSKYDAQGNRVWHKRVWVAETIQVWYLVAAVLLAGMWVGRWRYRRRHETAIADPERTEEGKAETIIGRWRL